jgi:hypothetical protein
MQAAVESEEVGYKASLCPLEQTDHTVFP